MWQIASDQFTAGIRQVVGGDDFSCLREWMLTSFLTQKCMTKCSFYAISKMLAPWDHESLDYFFYNPGIADQEIQVSM